MKRVFNRFACDNADGYEDVTEDDNCVIEEEDYNAWLEYFGIKYFFQ